MQVRRRGAAFGGHVGVTFRGGDRSGGVGLHSAGMWVSLSGGGGGALDGGFRDGQWGGAVGVG